MRYFIELAYKGTAFHGWQIQQNATSVQGLLNQALATALRKPTETMGSSRTDTGVHAVQQFAHFDFDTILDTQQLAYKLNKLLPADIAIHQIFEVDPATHARFDAISRKYEYRITQRKSPFLKHLAYFFDTPLNISAMNNACQLLLENNDFKCFSRIKSVVNNHICSITEAYWQEDVSSSLVFHIKANRFLHGMVRTIVGTLLAIGTENLSIDEFSGIIQSKDRRRAKRAAPAEGLFLVEVNY